MPVNSQTKPLSLSMSTLEDVGGAASPAAAGTQQRRFSNGYMGSDRTTFSASVKHVDMSRRTPLTYRSASTSRLASSGRWGSANAPMVDAASADKAGLDPHSASTLPAKP